MEQTGKTTGLLHRGKELLCRSRLFRRIFLSYLAFILVFLAGYSAVAIIDYNTNKRSELDAQYEAIASRLGTVFDNEMVQARYMTASINNSSALKNIYTKTVLSSSSLDSWLYEQAKSQMLSIQSQMNNLAISHLLLVFHNSNRIYTSSSVISLKDPYTGGLSGSGLTLDTVSNLLKTENSNVLMQREYLIFYSDYSYSYKGVSRGTVLVLMNPESVRKKIRERIGNDSIGFCVLSDGEPVLSDGIGEGIVYDCGSSINSAISYRLYVPADAFNVEFSGMILITLAIGLVCGLLAIGLAWYISFHHYLPYAHIAKLVTPEQDVVSADEGMIVDAMRKLITETDETRKKMLEIRPHAQNGVLQNVIHGNLDPKNLKILYQDNPGEMRFLYFAVAVVNLVLVPAGEGKEPSAAIMNRAEEAVRKLSAENCRWYEYVRDSHHLYAIVSFDDNPKWEELFYCLQEAVREAAADPDCRVTIGVSQMKEDMGQLQEACREAEEALTYMITGGRSQVYFFDPGVDPERKDYYFPKHAVRTLTQLLRSRDTDGIDAFFVDLLETNTKKHEVSARSMELLVDELHAATIYVMRDLNERQETPVSVTRVTGAATIEEILSYYQNVYETIIRKLPQFVKTDESVENSRKQILEYIDMHYLDKDLSLQQLTEKFHVTGKFISALCNTASGKNYLQYVQEKRIYYAKELLASGDYSVEEVADRSGYSNTLTFRRNFKTITGMNPSDFVK